MNKLALLHMFLSGMAFSLSLVYFSKRDLLGFGLGVTCLIGAINQGVLASIESQK